MDRFYIFIKDVDFGVFGGLRGEPHRTDGSERSKIQKFKNNVSKITNKKINISVPTVNIKVILPMRKLNFCGPAAM